MIHRFTSPLSSIASTCSDFGSSMVNFQSVCSGRHANGHHDSHCERGPNEDEAQRDYRTILEEIDRFYYF